MRRLGLLLQNEKTVSEKLRSQEAQRTAQDKLMDEYERELERLNTQLERVDRQAEEKNRQIEHLQVSLKNVEGRLVVQQDRERQVRA